MSVFNDVNSRRKRLLWLTAPLFPVILIGGWFYPPLGFFIPACMVLGMGIAAFRGRNWCNWLCPRGSFVDAVAAPLSPQRRITRFFKGMPFRIGVIVFLMAMMTYQIVIRWPDPFAIGGFFVMMLTSTTILALILAATIHQRTWCCFCPIGTIGNWIGRGRYPLKIDSQLCTECKLCAKVCPIQVEPYSFKSKKKEIMRDGDCLKCGLCVARCPAGALSFDEAAQ